MAVPQNKTELLAAIDKTYGKLAADFAAIPSNEPPKRRSKATPRAS